MSDSKQLVQRVGVFSSGLLKRPLTQAQKRYIQQQVLLYNSPDVDKSELVMRLALDVTESFTEAFMAKPEYPLQIKQEDPFDLHGMLSEIIMKPVGKDDMIRIRKPREITQDLRWGQDQYNLKGGFTRESLLAVKGIFTPENNHKKAYLTLDSSVAEFLEGNTKLRWDYISTLTETPTSTNSTSKIRDVVEIRIYSMVVNKFNSPMQRSTILIEEFAAQAFVAPNGRRFHTVGLLNDLDIPTDIRARAASVAAVGFAPDVTMHDKYELLSGFRFNEGRFKFAQPITTFDSITISVGDPFEKVPIRKYIINNCTFESINYRPFLFSFGVFVMNCNEDHYIPWTIPTPGQVYSLKISGFTTDQPVADARLIEYINTMEFTHGEVTDDQRITIIPQSVRQPGDGPLTNQFINFDMPNTLVGNPSTFTVRFDGYRIITNIEFTYIDPDS